MSRGTRRRGARWGWALLPALLLSGCLGGSPPPDYYRLAPTAVGAQPVATLPELGIALGPLEFPRYLDLPEIVTRDGDHHLALAEGPRWGGSLRSEVQRVLADDLAALLGTSRVATHPVEPRFPVDWRVLVDVRSFEGVRGESVLLRARWMVASAADGRAAVVEESVIQEQVEGPGWEAYVAAHSTALEELARRIAERIAVLAAPG